MALDRSSATATTEVEVIECECVVRCLRDFVGWDGLTFIDQSIQAALVVVDVLCTVHPVTTSTAFHGTIQEQIPRCMCRSAYRASIHSHWSRTWRGIYEFGARCIVPQTRGTGTTRRVIYYPIGSLTLFFRAVMRSGRLWKTANYLQPSMLPTVDSRTKVMGNSEGIFYELHSLQ